MAEWSYGIVPGMDTGMTGDKQYDQAWEDAQRKCPKTDPNNSDFNAYGQRVVMDGVYHCAIKRPGTEETPMGIRYTEYWTCFEYDLERYTNDGWETCDVMDKDERIVIDWIDQQPDSSFIKVLDNHPALQKRLCNTYLPPQGDGPELEKYDRMITKERAAHDRTMHEREERAWIERMENEKAFERAQAKREARA